MIIAITGSRSFIGPSSRALIYSALDTELAMLLCEGHTPESMLFRLGDAAGADHSALLWARERELPRRIYFADKQGFGAWCQSAALHPAELESAYLSSDWDDPAFGDRAGAYRNSDMIRGTFEELAADGAQRRADLCVSLWDGTSPGTRLCMAEARNAQVPIHQWGGVGPIEFRTVMQRDGELVTWQGAFLGTPA